MRKKKLIKLSLATAILAAIGGVVCNFNFKEVNSKAESISDLFEGKGISVAYGYANESGKKGFLLQTESDTNPIALKRNFVGGFEMDFETLDDENGKYGAGHIVFKFTTENGANFALHIKRDGALSSAYVEANGEKMGVNRSNTGFTAILNKTDVYTSIVSPSNYTVTFDPSTMQVCVNGVLIWDFSEENIDGRNVGFSFAPFTTYNVDFSMSEIAGRAKTLLYSINGESFAGNIIKDTGAPSIFVEKVADAVVGKEYVIPTPIAYDFALDSKITDISTEVFAPNGNKVEVTETGSFLPEIEGEYSILYKAKDGKSNTGIYELRIKAKTNYETEIVLGGFLPSDAPKNSEITIPGAIVVSEIFDYQFASRYANVSVFWNGEKIDGFSYEAKEGRKLSVTELGEYTIVYEYNKNSLEERVEYTIIVSENGYTDFGVLEYYATGDIFQVPEVTYFNGTQQVVATPVLTTPSGKTTSEKEVVLDEVGEYTLQYTSKDAPSKSKCFTVTYESSDLFEVSYGSLKSDYSSINNDLFGVQASLSAAGVVTYRNVIDFTGKTQDDTFLELIATPSRYYNVDFTQFLIRLTDTEDPNNWVEIKAFDMASNRADGTYVRARRNGTPFVSANDGFTTGKPGNPGYGGYPVLHSFRGNVNSMDYKKQTLRFGYDPTKKTLYCDSNGMDNNKYGRILADLCDPTWCGEWDGFTNNTVYLTITCAGISTSANFAITTVDGKDLTNGNRRVLPTQLPILELPDRSGKEMPKGVVGKNYLIPRCDAKDAFNKSLPVTVKVYQDYGLNTEKEIAHSEYFTPETVGNYTIVYEATDYLGRTERLEKSLIVYGANAYSNELKWKYEFNQPTRFTELSLGKYVGIADCKWTGGAGDMQTSVTVYDPDGDEVEIFSDKNVLIFFAEKVGDYSVEYTATDYLGEEVVYTITSRIQDATKPVLKDELILPDYVIDGITVALPNPIAYDYSLGKEVEAVILVDEGDGERVLESNLYTPIVASHGADVSIVYRYGEGANALVIENNLIGLKAKNEETGIDMRNYFVTNAGELTSDTQCITYTTTTDESGFQFVKPIPVNGFKFVFNVGAGTGEDWGNVSFTGVEILLSDSADPYYQISLRFTANGDGVLFSVNGGTPVKTAGSFVKESLVNLQFSYASTTHDIFNINGTKIGTVKKYLTGEEFHGFSSGAVYMNVRMLGVTGAASLKLYNINEQPLSSIGFDRIKPVIVSRSEVGTISVGDVVDVNTAYATDILSNVGEVLVNVKAPSGLYVKAKDGTILKNASATKAYQFVCEETGTYDIRYSVKDSSNNRGELKRLVNVTDKVPPVVELKEKLPEKVKVNTEVKLPQAVTNDTSKCTVSVMIYDPYSATYTSVSDNTYTFKHSGEYTIRYFVFDEFYNCVIVDYTITVY